MTNQNVYTSPVGEIQFMAAENPVTDSKTEKQNYSIKLAFDIKKDSKWLDEIKEINYAKVVTEQTYRGKSTELKAVLAKGKAFVEAKSTYKPMVFDAAGNEMEENPMFFAESTGTAQMMYTVYKGDKGGTINLVGIKIHTLDNPEGTGVDREARLAQLRELAKQG
jgi:hypothetical protein